MSNYDRIAISQKPDFYFSSNSSSDQSGKSLYNITNDALNVGQPIIVGNPSSWRVTNTESIELDSNPIFFREGNELEFVIQKLQPLETLCIFGDDDGFNGFFLNPMGAEVRFVDADLSLKSLSIDFKEWPEKMYVVITFDSIYCNLRVNDQSSQISYRETDPDSITSVSFKTTANNTYYIDGIGVYSDSFESKKNYIDASEFDYLNFVSSTYNATGTVFDGHRIQSKRYISNNEFNVDPTQVEYCLFNMTFPLSTDEDFSSISLESTILDMQMQYKTNYGSWATFTGNVSFVPTTDFYLLQIRVKEKDINRSFSIKVSSAFDDRITTLTPAELTPNGGPFYPDSYSTLMVNFPDGVELYGISYEGEWIEYVPNSIEILFMPKNSTKTIIIDSLDGSASCGTGGSITGFIAYLNGELVTDLDDVRVNQWNHLILTKVSTSANTFYLNSNSSRTETNNVEYSLLTSYPSVLSSDSCQELYSIISSYHKISVVDNPTDIIEGELDGTSPFKIYTYAWAIIGGGGV